MLMNAKDSVVLLIDMQEKLFPLITEAENVKANCIWLLKIADYLNIPIVTTEQYPQKLGSTIKELKTFSDPDWTKSKIHFSGLSDPGIADLVDDLPHSQYILLGIESQVCVLQTAIELCELDKQVFVVEECTGSRSQRDKTLALERLRQYGVEIVSREMVVFEWLAKAGTEEFKHINENFIK